MYLHRTLRREFGNRSQNRQENNFGYRWEVKPLIRNGPANFKGLLPTKNRTTFVSVENAILSGKEKRGTSVRTSMNLICSDCKSGADEEFVIPGQVINQRYYRYVLHRLGGQQVSPKHSELRRNQDWLIRHDSALARTVWSVQ